MSEFIVSARKYRPATFRSVVGQRHITQTLQSAIAKGQLAHAYLFTGPRGVGKTTCARIFAKAINCTAQTADHEACGQCESCVAFDQGRSWGIHELDAASNNSVEDIRSLIEKVRIAPQVGKYSVYIIDEVHMLSASAFNAFLKTLEEPPEYAIFILATTEKHKILPTILSRCQSYDFRRIGVKDIVEYLQYVAQSEAVTCDEESLNIIAQKADGGMRDALSTFDRVVSFSAGVLTLEKTAESVGALDFNTHFSAIDYSQQEDFTSLLMLYDSTLRAGFDGQLFIAGVAEHLRNLLVAKNPQTIPLLDVTGTLKDRYRAQAATIEVPWLMNAIALTCNTDATYRTATNKRLHVELALMKLCGLKKKSDNGTIADRFALPAVTLTAPTTPSVPIPAAPAPTLVATPALVATPIAAPVATPKPARVSITGFSINSSPQRETATEQRTATTPQPASSLSIEQLTEKLKADWEKVTSHWHDIGRPRIATALTVNRIENGKVTVLVANDTLRDELLQNKIELEGSIVKILGLHAEIEVEITEQKMVYKPVSAEQKLQHMIDKNPKVQRLLSTFDLTL